MLKYRLYFLCYYLCGILYTLAGVNHFINPDFYLRIMPDYLPAHELLVALSGVAEIVLGLGLILRPKSQLRIWSAWGLILLLIAVYPANIYSYTHLQELGDPRATVALIRLPFQFLFLWWAWVYTRPLPQHPISHA